jgi:hypothetical protein
MPTLTWTGKEDALRAASLVHQFDYKGALFYEAQIRRETNKLPAWRILFNFFKLARSDNPDN